MTPKDTRTLTPGTPVFCTVHGKDYGWHTLVAVRPRDGYIKVKGFNMWCPPYNFTLTQPEVR